MRRFLVLSAIFAAISALTGTVARAQSDLSSCNPGINKSGRESKRSVPYEVQIVRAKDAGVLGEEAGILRLEPRWLKATLFFRPAGGDKNTYLRAGELLQHDGPYRIRLSVDGKPYGEYPFTVSGGAISLEARQLREGTDPMDHITDHIAGGRYTSWWLRRDALK